MMNFRGRFWGKLRTMDYRGLCISSIMNVFMAAIISLGILSVITVMSMLPGMAGSSMFSIAEAADVRSYPTVAVMQFGNKAITSQGMRKYDFDSASEYAIYQLLASGWFDLVDYEQLGNIAKMHEINMSGLVDQSTAVQVGKFAGAQFMMIGNVTGLTTKESGLGYQHGRAGGAGVDVRTVIANVSVRLVDIETGQIVGAGLGKGESTSSGVEISFTKYRKKTQEKRNRYNYSENGRDSITSSGSNSASSDSTQSSSNSGTVNLSPEYTECVGDDVDISILNVAQDNLLPANNQSSSSIKNEESYIDSTNTNHVYNENYYGVEEQDYEVRDDYVIRIGSDSFSAVQVRNAISKAVRDSIYGDMGLMTMLNDGKKLKIKTGF